MEGSTLPLDAQDVLYVCTEDLARVLDVWFALCVYFRRLYVRLVGHVRDVRVGLTCLWCTE